MVRASNNKGDSDWSELNTKGAVVQDVPQIAPTLSRGELTNYQQVQIYWTLLESGYETGFTDLLYLNLYWEVAQVYVVRLKITDLSQTEYIEASVLMGEKYKFRIAAVNVHGEGPLSEPLEITVSSVPYKLEPANLESADMSQVTIEWTPAFNGGTPIASYNIYWDAGISDDVIFAGTSSEQRFQATNVEAGVFYRFKVAAVNEIGESKLSEWSIPLIAAEVPTEPLLVAKQTSTKSSITIDWTNPLSDNGSEITSYSIYVDSTLYSSVDASSFTFTVNGLVTG
jgi:hypothetical protein